MGVNMKKILTTLAIGSLLSLNLYASEIDEDLQHSKYDYYVAVKGIVTSGDTISEEEGSLEGDLGYGIGVDLGYILSHGFSAELDLSYVENDVTEVHEHGDGEDLSAYYISTSIDLIYTYHITHTIGVLAKVGFEYEYEKIDTLESSDDTGMIGAVGAEYKFAKDMALLGEFEYSSIDGPKGHNIYYLGIVYGF
jgi:opacity protein-like surface antigen